MILQGRPALLVLAALMVSLALNLFTGGLLLGRDLRPEPPPRGGGGPPLLRGLGPLPPELRRSLHEHLDPHRPELDQALQAMRDARREGIRLLQAPEIDAAQLRAVFAVMRQRGDAAQALAQEALIAAARATPAEARADWRPDADGQGRGRREH